MPKNRTLIPPTETESKEPPCALIPPTEIDSKWTKDFNVRPEPVRLLKVNIGRMLSDIGLSNIHIYICIYFDLSPQARERKVNINR